ncbi:SMR family transporter [Sphingomonas abaci]|uniref:Small multidrug resistance pump n=1 Tax=Sphingomonas abaci TaxID=237611 RepID=A0A7W7AK01_9SPHN|nr:small multidrug resistance pump [Sphingomonas abaci]
MSYLYLALAILSEVVATSFLKASDGFTRTGPTLIMAAGYGAAFYCLSLALRDIPTGIAYAIWSGVGIVLITVLAWTLRGERLDAAALIGMALIVAGVVVMNLFSGSARH